jgi:hypothetical protein
VTSKIPIFGAFAFRTIRPQEELRSEGKNLLPFLFWSRQDEESWKIKIATAP